MHFGKVITPQPLNEFVWSGILGQYTFSCNEISQRYLDQEPLNRRAWYLLAELSSPHIIGTWILDRDLPWLGNELNVHKLPILETNTGAQNTVWSTDHFKIVDQSSMKIKIGSYANWENNQVIYSITAVIAIRIDAYPSFPNTFTNIL